MSHQQPEFLPLGPDGILVRFALVSSPAVQDRVQAFRTLLEGAQLGGVLQVATSLCAVLVRFDPMHRTRTDVSADLETLAQTTGQDVADAAPKRLWTIPAAFDGDCAPQLAEVAQITGQSQAQAVQDVLDTELRVLAIGFAPGQPYLGLLPENWNMPRQDELVPNVPVGAIVVAVRQVVLFSAPNTTGWRHIGQAAFEPFRQDRSDPFLLRSGDRVRFERSSQSELEALKASSELGLGGARCTQLT